MGSTSMGSDPMLPDLMLPDRGFVAAGSGGGGLLAAADFGVRRAHYRDACSDSPTSATHSEGVDTLDSLAREALQHSILPVPQREILGA